MSRELTPQETAERSLIKTYRKTLWNPFIAAVKRYELVSPGDRIAVCISGGKDSMVLAKLMQELQKHTDQPFELSFLVMDPGYNPENRALIEENARTLGIPITVFNSDIFGIFLNMSHSGQIFLIMKVFVKIIAVIFILHIALLLIQYIIAGAISKKNPIAALKIMFPAYLTALGTQSSAATIPVTVQQATKLGLSDNIIKMVI